MKEIIERGDVEEVHDDGTLKVGGRLRHSSLADSFKHPIVIPKEHHVTKIIIAHNHEKTKHQGKVVTTNEIRSSGYWFPGMSRAVSSYIRQCVTCRRLRRPQEGQRMSDLPVERLELSPPFTYCGMDCFGPFVGKGFPLRKAGNRINDTGYSSPVSAHWPSTLRC
jgi:hypothetical protein